VLRDGELKGHLLMVFIGPLNVGKMVLLLWG